MHPLKRRSGQSDTPKRPDRSKRPGSPEPDRLPFLAVLGLGAYGIAESHAPAESVVAMLGALTALYWAYRCP